MQACAEAGTDYADLTGEVLFIRDSIDRCHDAAASTGARIVHCCGFDSVPSDLGVLLLHQAAQADGAGDLLDTTLVVRAMRGGLSGGTLASMMGQLDEVRASAGSRRLVGDPYALSPDRAAEPGLGDERDLDRARYDGELRMWTGPWVMAGVNTRVVRRSNALAGWAYGRRFRYQEVTGFGAGPAASAMAATAAAGIKAAEAGLAFGPSRALLRRLLPAPGHGPGERTRRTGFFRIQIHARTTAGHRYLGTIEAQGDPGYAATSVMLGETTLCLALDKDQLPGHAGVLTPATAMGAALATRLRSAGQTLATRQITPLPSGLPYPGQSAFAAAHLVRRGCRNEASKALTTTPSGQAPTRAMVASQIIHSYSLFLPASPPPRPHKLDPHPPPPRPPPPPTHAPPPPPPPPALPPPSSNFPPSPPPPPAICGMSEHWPGCPRGGRQRAPSQLAGFGARLAGLRRRRIRNPGSLLSFS